MDAPDTPPTSMQPEIQAVGPVTRPARIQTLDVLRGVAVLGILLMNIIAFGLPHWAYDDPTVAGGATGANLWTWIVTNMLFEGTLRAMFSMLFGAGVVLLTSRLEARMTDGGVDALTPADIYFRRNMWLIAFGLVDSYLLLWIGDILYVYGVVGVLLYVFRRLAPRHLIGIAAGLLIVITARNLYERHDLLRLMNDGERIESAQMAGIALTDDERETLERWNDKRDEIKPTPADVQEEVDAGHQSYPVMVFDAAPINFWLQSKYLLKHSILDAGSMMLLGMALMKLGVLPGAASRRTYWIMLLAGYGCGLAINAWETSTIIRGGFSITAFANASLTYDVGRLAMTMGHIGAIVLLLGSGLMGGLADRLAAVGQMALSNYLSTSVLCGLLFNGYGFGLFGALDRWQLYLVVAGVWIAQLIWSPWWLRRFQFGPAEWLWRSLTYWKRQPMIRRDARTS